MKDEDMRTEVDASDLEAEDNLLHDPRHAAEPMGQSPALTSDWPKPFPLKPPPAPAFPLEALIAPSIRAFVEAEAKSTQVPVDLSAVMALSQISTACAPKVYVYVTGDWQEQINLYLLAILETGERKSKCAKSHSAALRAHERESVKRAKPEIAAYKRQVRVCEASIKNLHKKAANAENEAKRESFVSKIASLDSKLEQLHEGRPVSPRMFCDDVTAEQFPRLLQEHHGAMSAMSDEGGFITAAFRYASGGNDAKIEPLLKAFAGEDIRVDRVGREPDYVRRPCLTLTAIVQAAWLRSLPHHDLLRGRGFFARFFCCVPVSLVGRRVEGTPIPLTVKDAYAATLGALADASCPRSEGGEYERHTMRLSPEAQEIRLRFFRRIEEELGPGGRLHGSRDFGNRMVGLAIRVAALSQLARDAHLPAPWETPISAAAMKAGVLVSIYALAHFKKALGLLTESPSLTFAQVAWEWIAARREPTFDRSDLYQAKRRRFEDEAANMNLGLEELEKRGYIRPVEVPGAGSGRPSAPFRRCAVNPRALVVGPTGEEQPPSLRSSSLYFLYAVPDSDEKRDFEPNGAKATPANDLERTSAAPDAGDRRPASDPDRLAEPDSEYREVLA